MARHERRAGVIQCGGLQVLGPGVSVCRAGAVLLLTDQANVWANNKAMDGPSVSACCAGAILLLAAQTDCLGPITLLLRPLTHCLVVIGRKFAWAAKTRRTGTGLM